MRMVFRKSPKEIHGVYVELRKSALHLVGWKHVLVCLQDGNIARKRGDKAKYGVFLGPSVSNPLGMY